MKVHISLLSERPICAFMCQRWLNLFSQDCFEVKKQKSETISKNGETNEVAMSASPYKPDDE